MRSDDADELYRLLSDPMVMRYLEPPYDRVQTEAFLHDAGSALSDMSSITNMMRTVWKSAGYCFRSTGGAATRRS
mgnify:CR=1 FL=1